MLIETTKDDEKAGWIAADYIVLARVMPQGFNDMDDLLEKSLKETKI